MNILNALARLRDDIKTWVTNNINNLNTKIDNKLDSGALPGAIDDAIAQAKESGDLKGEKGDKGDKGDSPIRGTDYWTDADKAEIKSYVDEAILNGAW
jgi:hypothetical protein